MLGIVGVDRRRMAVERIGGACWFHLEGTAVTSRFPADIACAHA